MVFSGHKIGAPKGVGALYVRDGIELESLIHGGHQEQGRRAGTLNVAGIVGFGKACALAQQQLDDDIVRMKQLRDRLQQGVPGSAGRLSQRSCGQPPAQHAQRQFFLH